MKVLAVETAADLAPLAGYAAVADRILFDARAPKGATRPGGLGAVFDWRLLENLDLKLPFMVSGGLNAEQRRGGRPRHPAPAASTCPQASSGRPASRIPR